MGYGRRAQERTVPRMSQFLCSLVSTVLSNAAHSRSWPRPGQLRLLRQPSDNRKPVTPLTPAGDQTADNLPLRIERWGAIMPRSISQFVMMAIRGGGCRRHRNRCRRCEIRVRADQEEVSSSTRPFLPKVLKELRETQQGKIAGFEQNHTKSDSHHIRPDELLPQICVWPQRATLTQEESTCHDLRGRRSER